MIIKKYILAFTGLFLSFFLVVHLSANALLLLPIEVAQDYYNHYSHLLRGNILIKIVSYFLYFSILLHTWVAIKNTLNNKSKRQVQYFSNNHKENSSWPSQNMALLGMIILVFIVIHMANFWAKVKLGLFINEALPVNQLGEIDIYKIVHTTFKMPLLVAFYALLAIPLALHLNHGVSSAFKDLGLYHRRYILLIKKISFIYSLIMGIGFGLIPLFVYFFR